MSYTVYNCKTELDAKKLLLYYYQKGYQWLSGKSLLDYTNWYNYKEETCYEVNHRTKTFEFTCLDYYGFLGIDIIIYPSRLSIMELLQERKNG